MAHQIIALLVGINQYPDGVSNLKGCVQDVQNIHDLLTTQYKVPDAHIRCLTDADANRAEVIKAFRTHLSQAKAGDTIFFHYSGHGSRENAPQEFWQYAPNHKNQTLVLADSRAAGGLDLANKELAVLLQELAPTKADLVLSIDACHSGGITRGEGDLLRQASRQVEKEGNNRSLDSYLEGHYSQMLHRTGQLEIPIVPHLVMSACTEYELAQETRHRTGAFSSALLEALQDPTANYATVFDLARIYLRQWGFSQTPGTTAYKGFNTMRQFLTHQPIENVLKQNIYFLDGQWWMNLGAIQGVATDVAQPTTLDVYAEDNPEEALGKGIITEVQPQKSAVEWQDFAPDEANRYVGQISHIAVAPLAIGIAGHAPTQELVEATLRAGRSGLVRLHQRLSKALYRLECLPNQAHLFDGLSGLKIQGIKGLGGADLRYMVDVMKTVAHWKRWLKLQNPAPKLSPDLAKLVLKEHRRSEEVMHLSNTTLYSARLVQISLEVHSQLKQTMYFSLIGLAQDFAVEVLHNLSAENAGDFSVKNKHRVNVRIDQNKYEAWYTYLLIVSTDQITDFVLTQAGLKLGHDVVHKGDSKGLASRSKLTRNPQVKNDWFTQRVSLKLVKELVELTSHPAQAFQLPESIVTIKGHSALRGWLCLESAFSQIRKEPIETLLNALGQCHWQPLDLLTTEQKLHVLTLTQLQNIEEVTSENPLELMLDLVLAPEETLLAMAFYGEEIHTLGEANASEGSLTTLALRQLVTHPKDAAICQICLVKGRREELKTLRGASF
ncbi:caspase family protein [Microscilla marina]|uniref:Peptidase C14 caspase domain-containing protein n=1 Tax=Microscilla marina ATCC 23134 TaxID=313606 RepID=A1ZX66_MICM2|nr:caspase family protein [Microscilla marina]EAY25047.1 conserved hypothetical protein [Microscilla marina ATCC 23134]